MGFTREAESPCPRVEGPTPQLATKRSLVPVVFFFIAGTRPSLVPYTKTKTHFSTLKPTRRSLVPYTKTKTIFPHCTKIKIFFVVVLIPKPFFKFTDKLIGKGCPTTGVLSNEKQRIASLHLAGTLRPTALPHDSALHL